MAAPVSAVGALWTALLAGIATSLLRSPNANPALDGDPCCPYPDTWGEVVLGVFSAACVACAFALLVLATVGVNE